MIHRIDRLQVELPPPPSELVADLQPRGRTKNGASAKAKPRTKARAK